MNEIVRGLRRSQLQFGRYPALSSVRKMAAAVAAVSVLSLCLITTAMSQSVDWVGVGGSVGEPHYSDLRQVNPGSVKRLGLAWSLDLDGEHSLEATPIEVGGILYFSGSASTVYAVDVMTVRLKWKCDPDSSSYRPYHLRYIFPVNRGVAHADGKVFIGTLDGRLIALSAADGKVVWSVKTLADDSYQTITGAPRVAGGKVVIGNGGADAGARGFVTACNIRDGRQAWRFYTAPGNPADGFEQPAMKLTASTWSGDGGRSEPAEPSGMEWSTTPRPICCVPDVLGFGGH